MQRQGSQNRSPARSEIAVASLVNSKLEEMFLAAVAWLVMVFVAAVVAPSEKEE